MSRGNLTPTSALAGGCNSDIYAAFHLIARSLAGFGNLHHRLDQIAAHFGPGRFAARCVKPAAILQQTVRIEAKEIRRARSAVGARNILAFVVKIGKRKLRPAGQFSHPVKSIRRIGDGIIGTNRRNAEPGGLQFARILLNAVKHRQNIWAVVAYEHDQRAAWPSNVAQRVSFAVSCGQHEIASLPAKITCRRCCCHRILYSALARLWVLRVPEQSPTK